MGFLSKTWKKVKKSASKVVKFHKKVFNEVLGGKYLKKALWDNKWGRMLTMTAAGIFTAGAASALMAGAGLTASLSAGGAALGSTVSGAASAIGSGISGLTGAVSGAGTSAAGSTLAGSGGLLSQAGTLGTTVGGGISSQTAVQAALGGAAPTGGAAGGILSSIASSPYTAPALISVGGNMVAGAAQASAQDKQYRREQAEEERKRNAQTAYGVSYDGTTNVDLQTAQAIQQAMAGSQPAGLLTQAGQLPAPNVPEPNIQIPQWWNQA